MDDLEKTKQLISQGKIEEAFKVIKEHEKEISWDDDLGKKWLFLVIDACITSQNAEQLAAIYHRFPEAFENKEKGSILVAQLYLYRRDISRYDTLRRSYQESKKEMWTLLDADRLNLEEKQLEAVDLLRRVKFRGHDEASRLMRLAGFVAKEDFNQALEYLQEALAVDPKNPEIRLFRARLLEGTGKDSLALTDYMVAAQLFPSHPLVQDHLAEFFCRKLQYSKALEIWTQNLGTDLIWLKVLFWSHVAHPASIQWDKLSLPPGHRAPFIQYLISLGPNQFWNPFAFDRIPNNSIYLSDTPFAFWLKLLHHLSQGEEEEAFSLLKKNPTKHISLYPELEIALLRALQWRSEKNFNIDLKEYPQETGREPVHFFTELEKHTDLLESDEAFSSIFLAASWFEAALQLHRVEIFPEEFPEWMLRAYVQALVTNRSPEKALLFAENQTQTDHCHLLIGELKLSLEQKDAGLEALELLLKEDTEIGKRAAWLTGITEMNAKNFLRAKEVVFNHPSLAKTVQGKEVLARVSLLEGKEDEAERLYISIADASSDAKMYLSQKAIKDKNWKEAKELTESLLLQFPNDLQIRQNLHHILHMEKDRAHGHLGDR